MSEDKAQELTAALANTLTKAIVENGMKEEAIRALQGSKPEPAEDYKAKARTLARKALQKMHGANPEKLSQLEEAEGQVELLMASLPAALLEMLAEEKTNWTKASLHMAKHLFGQEKNGLSAILEQAAANETSSGNDPAGLIDNVKVIGMESTLRENRALHTVQTLLTRTDYKGNVEGKAAHRTDNVFHFEGYLPTIAFTIPEYLDAYGAPKKDYGRGREEYHPEERKAALQALINLAKNLVVFDYTREYRDAKNKPRREVVRAIRPVIADLNIVKPEDAKKTSHLELKPCFVLVDQIETYFYMKPTDLYKELTAVGGSAEGKRELHY